jgi:hypothetical protein
VTIFKKKKKKGGPDWGCSMYKALDLIPSTVKLKMSPIKVRIVTQKAWYLKRQKTKHILVITINVNVFSSQLKCKKSQVKY